MNKQLIITVPNKILSEVTKPVTSFDSEFKKQAEILRKTLKTANFGIGLAANQIGIDKSVFVVEFEDPDGKETIPLQFFVNPQIVNYSDEEEKMEEGCLSVPNIFLDVERPNKIKIKAQDLNGKTFKLTAKGLLARLIQHENDHLHGKVFTQLAKKKLLSKYPELKNTKIVFIGTGIFAETILRGLILLGLNVTTIITEQGKPAGRKKEICPSPIANTAKIFNKILIETTDIKSEAGKIKQQNPDLIILADFGQLLSKEILNLPKIMAINAHPSLLPKYRGATPIPSAIFNGEKETGVTIIKMSPEIDKGEIVAQQAISISEMDNNFTLRDRLANLSLNVLIDVLPKIINAKVEIKPQDDSLATNSKKFKKEDGLINWQKKPEKIDRQIRALFGWPGAYTFINNKRLIIHQAHLDEDKLVLDVVQPEGKNIMLWHDFLRGYKGPKPDWFSIIKLYPVRK